MNHVIYLTPKYTETQNGIPIYINRHHANGWIETPKGERLKQMPKVNHFWRTAKCKLKKLQKLIS